MFIFNFSAKICAKTVFVPCPTSTAAQFKLRLPSLLYLIMAPAVAFEGVLDVFQKQLIPFVRIFPSGVISFCFPFQLMAVFNLFKQAVTSPMLLAFRCV